MKKLLIFIMCLPFFGLGQENNTKDILLKSGKIKLETKFNISPNSTEIVHGDYYRLIQFSEIPSETQKDILVEQGIQFLEYIPFNAYVVSVSTSFSNIEKLREFGAISLQSILPKHKIDPKIQNKEYPEWALKNGKLSIKVLLYKNADLINFKEKNSQYNIMSDNKIGNSLILEINPNDLIKVATINDVWYIEPIDPPSFPENKTGRTLHRSNVINTNYSSGRHYNGDGINIMMQDDGLVGPHIDRQGRVDQSNCSGCSSSSNNDHGDHVSGTIMGAGNLDPLGKGMADGAFLYVYSSSNNNYYDVPTIYQNNDVIITSKSYSNGCNAGYTSLARDLDEQINLHPSLTHVFSAGNSGSSNCSYGAGSGWGNVTGGHKQAKNVITVANLTSTGALASSSSRGPAADGRIKPDIGAKGTSVYSPVSPYTYASYTGTSMSCPGIAGVMAQLYQGYKELNGGQNPASSLMKCLLLNSADDIGNAGPDFKHGWGEVNALRAIKILENNNYLSSSISQGATNTHSITVPSGTKLVKVMVYWHDKEASTSSSISLVNDLNIQLNSSTGSSYNPWVLDATPNSTNLDQDAVRGIDNLNNMEQVTLSNPPSGSYTLTVNGYAIPYGPQEYWVTYEFLTDDVQLTYPIGGEGLVPGESEYIRWDAHETSGSFTLEYTINGGSSWNTISSSVSGSSRYYNWTVPNNITANAMIRVSRNGYTDQSDATFTIIDVPQNVSINWLCPDSIYVSWSAVSGATSYEVSMLGQKYMDSMTTTNNLTALISNPNPSVTDSWFSVCAKVNNGEGRRAVAINAQTVNPGCVGYGCTDPNAYNYDPTAIYDNGSCIYCNTNLPYSENFDNSIGSWTNTGSAGNWTLNSGGTPSNSTGPTDDLTGGGNYMYIESTSPNFPNIGPFTLTSECFDLSGSTNPSLSFYYNMYGSAMGTLNVYANGSLIWSLSGDQGQGWNLVQIPLTSVGNSLIIDFEGTTGTSYTSDIAIDDISIIGTQGTTGCTNLTAFNYNPNATIDDGTCCYISGCTNPTAFNYNSLSCFDDGSCTAVVVGCMNSNSTNYNPTANTSIAYGGITNPNVGTGVYFTANQHLVLDCNQESTIVSAVVYTQSSNTVTFELRDGNGSVIDDTTLSLIVGGQRIDLNFNVPIGTDYQLGVSAIGSGLWRNNGGVNYPYDIGGLINIKYSSALSNPYGFYYFFYDIEVESRCILPVNIYGCTDSTSINYNPNATVDDGSCISCVYGCTDSTSFNYNISATCDDGSCVLVLYGCTDSTAINYNPNVNTNDGSCLFYGCTDPTATNYNATAIVGCDASGSNSCCIYPANCGPVTGVNLTDVIHDRSTFNWDNMNSSTCQVDQIRFRYRAVGTNSWSTKTMGVPVGSGCNTSNTSKLVLGLTPSTTYEYNFKIWYCNASIVNWHAGGTFTTSPDCDNVINVVPTPITTTKTQFCWDTVSTYAFVRLQYRENLPGSSFSNIGGMGVMSPVLCKDKNGLIPGTDYRVMWRTWCNPSGGPYRSPQWDGPVTWTQPNSIKVEGEISINNLEVYPNPSRDVFNVSFNSDIKQSIEVRIVNLLGEDIFTDNLKNFVGEYTHSFYLSEYSKGIYLLELNSDNGLVNKKLILQ